MSFYRIPMTTHEPPSKDKVAEFLKLVDAPGNQPVYVHCQGGRHRTGVMTAVYRMTKDHWTAAQDFAEMKKYRFGADFLHPEFKQFVHGYQPEVRAPAVAAISPLDIPDRRGYDGERKAKCLPPSRTRSKISSAHAASRRTSRCSAARMPRGRALSTGIAGLDDLLRGGFPRGQVSEVHGAASSGRTALVLALVARLTRAGSLVAWVDPGDRLDPASAAAAGVAPAAAALAARGSAAGATRARCCPRSPRWARCSDPACSKPSSSTSPASPPPRASACPARRGSACSGSSRISPPRSSSSPTATSRTVPAGAALALKAAAPRWSGAPPARVLRGVGRRGARGAARPARGDRRAAAPAPERGG